MKTRFSGIKRTALVAFALLMCASILFVGCAASRDGGAMTNDVPAPQADFGGNESEHGFSGSYVEDKEEAPGGAASNENNVFAGRKVIRDANLTVQTLEFDSFMKNAIKKMRELGGYIQEHSVDVRSGRNANQLKVASTVMRIPADKLDEFLLEIDGLGTVIKRDESATDVTDSYFDVQAKLSSLRTEYDTLLKLLSDAESLDNIITLQERLSSVRYEIERYETRIRSYDSLIAFSTVSMSISEVERETVVEPETFGQEVARRFKESMADVGDGFASFAKWFIGDLPHIVVTLFFIALPLVIALIIVKSVKKRKLKRRRELEETANNANR